MVDHSPVMDSVVNPHQRFPVRLAGVESAWVEGAEVSIVADNVAAASNAVARC
jgi:hypothetical protein